MEQSLKVPEMGLNLKFKNLPIYVNYQFMSFTNLCHVPN